MISDIRFGQVSILPTSGKHIYVTSNPNSGRDFLPFVIREIPYNVSAHLYLHSDGRWHVGPESEPEYRRPYGHFYMTRLDQRFKDASVPARRAALAAIEEFVNQWVVTHAGDLVQAHFAELTATLQRLEGQRDAKAKELADLDAEIADVRARIVND